jgi:hypothetical protein
MSQKHRIIVPNDVKPKPEKHELEAAEIISEHFKSDVEFIKRANGKTADIKVVATGANWEMKSPKGNGKNTIQNNLRKADDQSPNVVLDLCRIKLHQTNAINRAKYELSKANKIKQLLVITKSKKVLVLK